MEAPTLSYLFSHPTELGLSFERPLGLALLLLLPAFLLLRGRIGHRAARLRTAAYAALVLATAGLAFTVALPSQRLSLVVAVDTSESIDEEGLDWAKRYVGETVRALAPGDEVAVITFAKDVELSYAPGPPSESVTFSTPARRGATNLDLALDTATALFSPDSLHRLLVISDGNETRGDSRRQIPRLRQGGIRVDAAVPLRRRLPDVRLEKLLVASLVAEEHVVPLRVVARNTGKLRPAVLSLYLDGKVMDSAAVELQPGLSSFDLPTELSGRGSHRLKAALLVPDDPTPSNNFREVGVTVRAPTHVLLIERSGRSPLAGTLERKGITVDRRSPEAFPDTLDQLLTFDDVHSRGSARLRL